MYDLYARDDGARTFQTEGAVTMATATAVAAPVATAAAPVQESTEAAPRTEQRLLPARGRLDRRGKGDRQEGAHLHGDQGPADHQQVLVRRCVSVRAAAVIQGAGPRRAGIRGLWMRRRKPEAVRLRRHGDGAHRRFVLHLLGRAQRPGDGLDLSRRIGGAEAEVAAADGALREDRLLRPHRAAGGFGNKRRHD